MIDYISPILSNVGLTITATLFMTFGFIILMYNNLYKEVSIQVPGEVVGIEKYISTYRSGQTKTKRLMYRSIISFLYNGDETFFQTSFGQNTIPRRIGEKVKVEYLVNLPSSVRVAGKKIYHYLVFGFLSVSTVLLVVTFNHDEIANHLKLFRLAIPFVTNIFILRFLKIFFTKHGGVTGFMKQNNPIKTKDELNKLDILWSNEGIFKEESRVYKPFLYVLPVLLSLSIWPVFIFLPKFLVRPYVKSNLNIKLMQFDELKIFLNEVMNHSQMQREFIILGASSFFIICFIYSFIVTLKRLKV